MNKLRIFVSSVQKELEVERVAVAGWVSADSHLSEFCEVVLFEKEPLSGKRICKPYLECLKACHIYLLILDCEYGNPPEFSATHEEYRFARDHGLPILVFIKGMTDGKREKKTQEFLDEIKADGNTYRRFHDRVDLKSEIREAMRRVLNESFGMDVSDERAGISESVESASMFELQALDVAAEELDAGAARGWLQAIRAAGADELLSEDSLFNALRQKGLVRKEGSGFQTQASGLIFLGRDPSFRFPQCRIFADAFKGKLAESTPSDQMTLSEAAQSMVQQVWKFVQKNTRHPMRVNGLIRVSLDEYPEEAVRESVVNAIAHRNYEDSSRQILVKLFADRLEILSPGAPMRPLTVAKIKKGNCLPCSRNPILGQYLNHMRLMDQRGSGIGRMQAAMLNHGLDTPEYDLTEGYFRVTLKGPGEDLDRLKISAVASAGLPPAVEEQLNARQKRILVHVSEAGFVTSGWCRKEFSVTYNTAYRDLSALVDLRLLNQKGKGRSTHYVWVGAGS